MERPTTLSKEEILDIYNMPLLELVFKAATVHRENHDPSKIQMSSLISIKTGGCPEDCGYCPQAARYHTDIEKNELMDVDEVLRLAQNAKSNGSSRVCMGAAWRNVKNNKEFDKVVDMVSEVSKMDMEVCCTLGMLTEEQAIRLSNAGLGYYNHNLDTSEEYYKEVISTRGYEDRLETLDNVRKGALKVCSGGIIGMGEKAEDRVDMLYTLSKLTPQPESVPINALVPVEGTPLEEQKTVPSWDLIRMIATARIALPNTTVRLSAGRLQLSKETQALCFLAGASSIFAGDKLLTTPNPDKNEDKELLEILGLSPSKYIKEDKKIVKTKDSNTDKTKKWSRPGHTIERNVKAAEKRKEIIGKE